jgi:hypothetical protein
MFLHKIKFLTFGRSTGLWRKSAFGAPKPPTTRELRTGFRVEMTAITAGSEPYRKPFAARVGSELTWQDSNFHITVSKNTFEMSTEFPLFWPKIRGDFCTTSCGSEQTGT